MIREGVSLETQRNEALHPLFWGSDHKN